MNYERILQTHAVSMKRSFAKKEPLIIFDQLLKIKKVEWMCVTKALCFFAFYHLEKEKERKKIIMKDF